MSETVRRFKKGDAVAFLSSWDGKGTVTIRRAVVHSCGRVLMRLRDAATGELFGTEYRPENPSIVSGGRHVVLDATDAELEALALADGAELVAYDRARLETLIERNPDTYGYHAALRRSIAELHEPRFRWHGEA